MHPMMNIVFCLVLLVLRSILFFHLFLTGYIFKTHYSSTRKNPADKFINVNNHLKMDKWLKQWQIR